MKTGNGYAVGALLVASGWVMAQAPLPISYVDTKTATPAATAPASAASDPSGRVKPAGYRPPEEIVRVAPTPNAVPAPTAAIGAEPSHVLPYGGYIDPARHNTVWGSADFIMWRINNGRVPAINAQPPVGVLTVQTFDFLNTVDSSGGTTTVTEPGQIGFFPVRIQDVPGLPNNGDANLGEHLGGRFTVGGWLTPDQLIGLEGTFFFLQQRGILLAAGSSGANNQVVFTTPFVDREFLVTPGSTTIQAGTPPITVTTPPTRTQTGTFPIFFVRQLDSAVTAGLSNSMWGGAINARSTCCYFGPVAVGGLVGFRHLQFTEDLDMNGSFGLTTPPTVLDTSDPTGRLRPDNLPANIVLQTRDLVSARNHFYGGNIGLDFDAEYCGFFVNLRTQVAMGGMHQRVNVTSFTDTTTSATAFAPAGSTSTPGGLLFNQLDNGVHKRDRISFIPELNLKAGYQFCSWFRGYVGYDVMYISNVVRPGDVSAPLTTSGSLQNSSAPTTGQATANGTGVSNVSVTQPSFRFNDSNLWTQGFNFGVEFSY